MTSNDKIIEMGTLMLKADLTDSMDDCDLCQREFDRLNQEEFLLAHFAYKMLLGRKPFAVHAKTINPRLYEIATMLGAQVMSCPDNLNLVDDPDIAAVVFLPPGWEGKQQ